MVPDLFYFCIAIVLVGYIEEIGTHVGFVLESELALVPTTVEVCGPLTEEGAVRCTALFCGPQSLEALLDDSRVLAVVVGVHLHVRGTYVHLVAGAL